MLSMSFIVVSLAIIFFGMVSKKAHSSILTPPMFFVLAGILLCESVSGLVSLGTSEPTVHFIGELTLMIVLFIDASRIDLRALRKNFVLPLRLLGVGLPLAIIFGSVSGLWLFPEFTMWEAAILATVLAPTDAALGQAVVSSPDVPQRMRQALNVESGLNDGICVPVIFLLAVAAGLQEQTINESMTFAVKQMLFGPVIGVAVGYLGGRGVAYAINAGWMDKTFRQLSLVALAPLSFGVAEWFHGNGFIAAFLAGLTLGHVARDVCKEVYEFGEVEGELLVLLVFLIFGTAMVWPVITHLTWQMVVYAVLSLTVVRFFSVWLSLIGSRLKWPSYIFLGWFGPRGLASILFAILVVDEGKFAANHRIFEIATLTVLFSVILHGITAFPGAKWYARHIQCEHKAMDAEKEEVTTMPIRGHSLF